MSKRIRKHASVLNTLYTAKPKLLRSIIKAGDRELINCISECSLNVLSGNVPLTLGEKRKLSRHRHRLREIRKKSLSVRRKKKIIQSGGFLSALLGPLIGTVIPAITSLFTGK